MLCEKCWSDAYLRSLGTGKSQYTVYLEILEERKDNPCVLEEAQLTQRALDGAYCDCFMADVPLTLVNGKCEACGKPPRQ